MKNYSSIQQVLQMMTKDDGVPPTPDNIGGWDFKPKYIKYVKIIKDCGFGASEEDACFPVFALGDERKNNKYTTFNGKTADHLFFDDGQFILADGSLYLFENQNSEKLYISIDVNGLIKSPNRWGYDLFTFQIMKDGKVLPMGAEGTDFTDLTTLCSKSSLHKYNGIACTYKALTDKNYWKNIKL